MAENKRFFVSVIIASVDAFWGGSQNEDTTLAEVKGHFKLLLIPPNGTYFLA